MHKRKILLQENVQMNLVFPRNKRKVKKKHQRKENGSGCFAYFVKLKTNYTIQWIQHSNKDTDNESEDEKITHTDISIVN